MLLGIVVESRQEKGNVAPLMKETEEDNAKTRNIIIVITAKIDIDDDKRGIQ